MDTVTTIPDEALQYAARMVDAIRSCTGHHFNLERRPGLPVVYRCSVCQGVVSPGMAELYAHGLRHGREDAAKSGPGILPE